MPSSTDISVTLDSIDLDVSKKELQQMAKDNVKALADSGYLEAGQKYAKLSAFMIYAEAFKKELKDYAIDEVLMEDNSRAQMGNVLLEIANSGDRLDYDADPVHKALNVQLKARQKELKNSRSTTNIVVDPDGAEVPKVPVKTPSSTIIKATIK